MKLTISSQEVIDELNRLCTTLAEKLDILDGDERKRLFAIQFMATGVLFEQMVETLPEDLRIEYKKHVSTFREHIKSEFDLDDVTTTTVN
jgi:hypothetical protein